MANAHDEKMSRARAAEPTVLYHRKRSPEILLEKVPVALPSGLRYEAHTLRTGGNTRSVVVIATKREELLLVQSYRPSLGELIWELPRGFGEGDPDDPRQAERDGARELREETGYEATRCEFVGEFVLDTSFYPARVAAIRCTVTAEAPVALPDGEVEQHRWFPLKELPLLLSRGVLRDGASLAALAIAGL